LLFAHILVKSKYVKLRPKRSAAYSTNITEYISSTDMFRISDNLQPVIIQEGCIY